MDWVNLVGLVFSAVGAVVIVSGVIVRGVDAVEAVTFGLAGDTPEENLAQPAVQDRLRQSRRAVIGLAFFAVGFVLQAVAAWPGGVDLAGVDAGAWIALAGLTVTVYVAVVTTWQVHRSGAVRQP